MRFIKAVFLLLASFTGLKAQISVTGSVNHIIPNGIDSTGDINLTVSGGTSPYSYLWNPGAYTTQNISGVTKNNYSVKIKDAGSDSVIYNYSLGYKVAWGSVIGCIPKHDTLVTYGTYTWASAVSKNTLAGGIDGWFEYILKDVGQYKGIGFLDSLSSDVQAYSDIDYGFYNHAASHILYGILNGVYYSVGTYPDESTVLRVERIGDTIHLMVNGVIVKTAVSSADALKNWKIKGSVYTSSSASLINVGCSFDQIGNVDFVNYSRLNPLVIHSSGLSITDGSISVTDLQNFAYSGASSYTWQPGSVNSSSVTALGIGAYSVTVEDSLQQRNTVRYNIGYKAIWDSIAGAVVNGDTLTATGAYTWGRAVSKNVLIGGRDGWFEYILKDKGQYKGVGFLDSLSPDPTSYADIDYGFYNHVGTNTLYGILNGVYYSLGTFPTESAVLRAERIGDTINLKVNGVIMQTEVSSTGVQKNWRIKGDVYSGTYSNLMHVGCSFYRQDVDSFGDYTPLIPTIVHNSGPSTSDGSISVKGLLTGTDTFTWQPGSVASNSLTGQPVGSYSVIAEDSIGQKSRYIYNIGYKVNWGSLYGVELKHDTVMTTGSIYATDHAVSKNTLAGGTDGWFEYVITDLNQYKAIGFSDSISLDFQTNGDIDFGFNYLAYNQTAVVYISGSFGTVTPVTEGSVLRVERLGDTINLKVNGVIVTSVISHDDVQKAWKIKGDLSVYDNASFINVGCSFYQLGNTTFPNYTPLVPTVVHSSGLSAIDGSIDVTPLLGGSCTYLWLPDFVSGSLLTAQGIGTHTVIVEDSINNVNSLSYNIGYKVNWGSLFGSQSKGDSLITNGSYNWGRGISKNTLTGGTDGWFEYVLKNGGEYKFIGFLDSLSEDLGNVYDFDYGFYFSGSVLYGITQGNWFILDYYTKPEGTMVRVERIGDTINLKINNVIVNSTVSHSDTQKAWKIKGLVNNNVATTLINVGCSFYQQGNSEFANFTPLIPTVVHSSGFSLADGSISVQGLFLGTNTYTWQPGSIASNSLTGLSIGAYSVAVEDSVLNRNDYVYNVGYKVNWGSNYKSESRNDSLIDKGTGYIFGNATSKNTLPGGTDGWFEYILKTTTEYKAVGFLDSLSTLVLDDYNDIDYGFYHIPNGGNNVLYAIDHGGLIFLSYLSPEGTVLRMERVGDTVNFKMNGTVVYTLINSEAAQKAWKIKGCVDLSTLVNVGCSFYGEGNTVFPNYTRLVPTVIHSSGPAITDGSIDVTGLLGGTNSYTWQPGSIASNSLTGLSIGAYSVAVEDSVLNRDDYVYNVGYKVNWGSNYKSESRNDSLIDKGTGYIFGNATSKNTLPGGTDGWFEYILKTTTEYKAVGFLDSLSTLVLDDYNDIDYGFYHIPNGGNNVLYAIDHGGLIFLSYLSPEGTVLRMERVGDTVNFKMNGTVVYTLINSEAAQKAWKIKGCVDLSTLVNVGCSFYGEGNTVFPNYTRLVPTVVHSSAVSAYNGSVNVTGLLGGANTYTWQPGAVTSASLISQPAGNYKVSVEDNLHHINTLSYNIGYKAIWDSLSGTTVSGDTLTTAGAFTWNRGVSKNTLGGGEDGWLEYILKETDDRKFIGFLDSLSSDPQDYGDIDYGFYHIPNGGLDILYTVDHGSLSFLSFLSPEGTILRVERIGDTVNLKMDGITVYSVTDAAAAQKNWNLKGVLYGVAGTRLTNVGCSFPAIIVPPDSIPPDTVLTINYPDSIYSQNISAPVSIIRTGPAGGSYSSSPEGLGIVLTTGAILPDKSIAGLYIITYTVELPGGPVKTATTTVTIKEKCNFTLNPLSEIQLCEGELMDVSLLSTSATQYSWTPSTGLSCTTCSNTTVTGVAGVSQYTVLGYNEGYEHPSCYSAILHVTVKTDCITDNIVGCCFSNYGAAVYVSDQNTYVNVYCNLLNELGQYPDGSIKKGEFTSKGIVSVSLDWIHNAKNNLYLTNQGTTNFFGASQNITGNSNTHFNGLFLTGNGIKTTWIDEYANANVNLTTNELHLQNNVFFMKNANAAVTNTVLASGIPAVGGGFVSTLKQGYFSRALKPSTVYLYPMGSHASGIAPFRYRPIEMYDVEDYTEVSLNFMNNLPATTDGAFTNVNHLTDLAPNVTAINNLYYYKIKETTPLLGSFNLGIKSYFPVTDGQFQSLAEWEKDPSQTYNWWGSATGLGSSNIPSANLSFYGMINAYSNGYQTFTDEPFVLAKAGIYINTVDYGGNGTVITISSPSNPGGTGSSGSGLDNPVGTGSSSGNSGGGTLTNITPPITPGDYIITIAPGDDCTTPGKIKFTVDNNGKISASSVQYGLVGSSTYLGQLSPDVYTIDNINTGLIFNSTPKSLLKECINGITIGTSTGNDFIVDYTSLLSGSEVLNVNIPALLSGVTLGSFELYDISGGSALYTTSLTQGINNSITLPNTLVQGVYNLKFTVGPETVKGQFIIK